MVENSFKYLKQFLIALEDLEDAEKHRATYCLCYYWFNREFPPEATPYDKMYVKSQMRLIEGQDEYNARQKEIGKEGGRPKKATEEEIRGALIEMFQNGEKITSDALGARVGLSGDTIRKRPTWKNKDSILAELNREQSDTQASISAFNF